MSSLREGSWAAWMDAQYAAQHAAHAVDPSVLDAWRVAADAYGLAASVPGTNRMIWTGRLRWVMSSYKSRNCSPVVLCTAYTLTNARPLTARCAWDQRVRSRLIGSKLQGRQPDEQKTPYRPVKRSEAARTPIKQLRIGSFDGSLSSRDLEVERRGA